MRKIADSKYSGDPHDLNYRSDPSRNGTHCQCIMGLWLEQNDVKNRMGINMTAVCLVQIPIKNEGK